MTPSFLSSYFPYEEIVVCLRLYHLLKASIHLALELKYDVKRTKKALVHSSFFLSAHTMELYWNTVPLYVMHFRLELESQVVFLALAGCCCTGSLGWICKGYVCG